MKRNQESLDRLRGVSPFAACSDRELAFIDRQMNHHVSAAGTVLTDEGVNGRQFFVIVEGTAVVHVGDTRISQLGPGDFFGEIALLDWGTRTATVTAETELVTLVSSVQEFDTILEFAPSVARRLLVGLSRRLRAADIALASSTADMIGGA